MKTKLIIGILSVLAISIAIPTYALLNNKVLNFVNPNGEQVFQDGEGNLYTHFGAGEEEKDLGAINFVYYAGDIIGTKVGTSTNPVGFYGANTATSTYRMATGGTFNDYSLALYAENASSSANVHLSVFGSNDYDCDTSSTTTSLADTVVTGDINWFDISANQKNLAGSQSLAGTSTIAWDTSGATGHGKVITFEDLNIECLRVDVSASSTELYGELRMKN